MINEDYPQLVSHYMNATKKVFGHWIKVKEENYSKFRVLEDDLRDIGANSKEYAYTVIAMLKNWSQTKGMNFVPVNVFCGDWAFGKFVKVWKSKTVTIRDDPKLELLHCERIVAEAYVAANLGDNSVPFDEVVASMEPLLSSAWIKLYEQHPEFRSCSGEIINEIASRYKIRYAKSYRSLLHKVKLCVMTDRVIKHANI